MCTYVRRSRDPENQWRFLLSEDSCQAAREYLISAGTDVDRIPPLIWPDDAVAAYQEHTYAPWQFTTKGDIRRRKIKDMERSLWHKREYGVVKRRALYVWVFWCPGLFGFAYRGWWLYLIGRDVKSSKYLERDRGMMEQITRLFPVLEPDLFGELDMHEWKQAFIRRYRRGTWCGKPQGKAAVWAEVEGGCIRTILGRADWPKTKGE